MPAARVGTELLLERLRPYETGNRMAAALVAATVPPLTAGPRRTHPCRYPDGLRPQQLVDTVGYLMQPSRNADLRSPALQVLEQRFAEVQPYLDRSGWPSWTAHRSRRPAAGCGPHGLAAA